MSNRTLAAPLSDSARGAWIDRLRKLSLCQPDEANDEWELLLKDLKIPLDYFLAVLEVLKQGRWSSSDNPKAYVRKAAIAEARKLNLPFRRRNDTQEFADRHLVYMAGATLDAATTPIGVKAALNDETSDHGPQRLPLLKGRHRSLEQIDHSGEHRTKEEMFYENQPQLSPDWWVDDKAPGSCSYQLQEFNRASNCDEQLFLLFPEKGASTLDLERLAIAAGLDSQQIEVLRYRRRGLSRDFALSIQPDEDSRKAIQSAWRRFDRMGMKKLRECFKKLAS